MYTFIINLHLIRIIYLDKHGAKHSTIYPHGKYSPSLALSRFILRKLPKKRQTERKRYQKLEEESSASLVRNLYPTN